MGQLRIEYGAFGGARGLLGGQIDADGADPLGAVTLSVTAAATASGSQPVVAANAGASVFARLTALDAAMYVDVAPVPDPTAEPRRLLLPGYPVRVHVSGGDRFAAILAGDVATSGGAATAAGEAHIGEVGGNTGACSAVPTVQAAAYAAGQVLGGKLTLSGLARIAAGTGIIQTVDLYSKAAQTAAVDVLIFHADPSGSTFADKAALALAVADFDKLSGIVHLSDWTSLGTPSITQALGIGMAFKLPAGLVDGFAVLVARGAITPASASDLKLAVKSLRD